MILQMNFRHVLNAWCYEHVIYLYHTYTRYCVFLYILDNTQDNALTL